jgi:hypothetical protein
MAKAQSLFAGFDFVKTTFAAQAAWRGVAAYDDLARGVTLGTTELEHGTRASNASACPSAKQ